MTGHTSSPKVSKARNPRNLWEVGSKTRAKQVLGKFCKFRNKNFTLNRVPGTETSLLLSVPVSLFASRKAHQTNSDKLRRLFERKLFVIQSRQRWLLIWSIQRAWYLVFGKVRIKVLSGFQNSVNMTLRFSCRTKILANDQNAANKK